MWDYGKQVYLGGFEVLQLIKKKPESSSGNLMAIAQQVIQQKQENQDQSPVPIASTAPTTTSPALSLHRRWSCTRSWGLSALEISKVLSHRPAGLESKPLLLTAPHRSNSSPSLCLGLGTGSTAKHAVNRIGELLKQGKLQNIVGIPTSKMSHEQALSLGVLLSDLDSHPVLDLAFDSADEVDPHLDLVKGRGRFFLREKLVEGACKKFVCIVNESKLVKHLGGSRLAMPVEICAILLEIHDQKAPGFV